MKKLALVLVLALASFGALAQQVDSTQVKKKTDGGLVGDAANGLAVGVVRASSAPSSPVTGQLWCDTTLSPCTLKQYSGSTWIAPQVNAAITTQADVSSFPGSPVDGQIFYSKAEHALWVYDSTEAKWNSIGSSLTTSGASIQDVYTGTLVSAPGAATVATSATAGSLSAGTYSYKVTCRNSTGGETTAGTASNTITSLVSKSVDLSSIPTCGTGGTNRSIFRTKVNQAGTGPWYWVANINDNSTTTLHDGLADASALFLAPEINYSGAMPSGWTIANNTTANGAGVTGRGTMVFRANVPTCACCSTPTADTWTRIVRDITSYSSGNYTIQFRLYQQGITGDTNLGATCPVHFGMRNGSGDTAVRQWWGEGSTFSTGCVSLATITLPFTSSNHNWLTYQQRTTIGGATGAVTQATNPWPEVDALPMYFKIVKRGNYVSVFWSADAVNWRSDTSCGGGTNTNSGCVLGTLLGPSTTQFEIPAAVFTNTAQNGFYIEIDSWTLTVN